MNQTTNKREELLKGKKIYQIINSKVVQAGPAITISEAVSAMRENRSGYVVLVEDNKIVGIFTETDVALKVLGKDVPLDDPVSSLMSPKPVVMTPQDSVGDAIDLMAEKNIYHLPLVDEQKNLAGMLSVRTLIHFLAEYYPTEVYNLPPDPARMPRTSEGG